MQVVFPVMVRKGHAFYGTVHTSHLNLEIFSETQVKYFKNQQPKKSVNVY